MFSILTEKWHCGPIEGITAVGTEERKGRGNLKEVKTSGKKSRVKSKYYEVVRGQGQAVTSPSFFLAWTIFFDNFSFRIGDPLEISSELSTTVLDRVRAPGSVL